MSTDLCLHDGIEDASDCPLAPDLSILDTADPALNPHSFRHPAYAMNDHCIVCGEYEEDGPHIG